MKHIYYINGKKHPKKLVDMIMSHVTPENFIKYANRYEITVCNIDKDGSKTYESII